MMFGGRPARFSWSPGWSPVVFALLGLVLPSRPPTFALTRVIFWALEESASRPAPFAELDSLLLSLLSSEPHPAPPSARTAHTPRARMGSRALISRTLIQTCRFRPSPFSGGGGAGYPYLRSKDYRR